MKTIAAYLIVVGVFLLGCIPSLHPIYTPDTLIHYDEVIGVYDSDGENWHFEKSEKKDGYTYIMLDGANPDSLIPHYEIHFIELNDIIFADFYPLYHDSDLDLGSDYLRMHTFAKVILTDTKLSFYYPDAEELEKLFRQGKVRLKHELYEEADNILITASTKDLQRFLKKYGRDDRLFNADSSLKRIAAR